jgi:hypothetical protein
MRNEELLFDALGGIDPALVEDAAPEKGAAVSASDGIAGRRKRGIRPGVLLAAAVSVILLTTAAAAGVFSGRMRVRIYTEEENEKLGGIRNEVYRMVLDDWSGYAVLPEDVMETLRGLRQPASDLYGRDDHRSARVKADAGELLLFDSWNEAAQWLDCGMLTHDWPLSENMPYGVEVWYNNGEGYRGIENVGIHGQFAAPDFRFFLTAMIPLNEEAVGIYNGGLATYKAYGYPEVVTEEWISPQGFETTIVTTTDGARGGWMSNAHFILNGVVYRISVFDPDFDTAIAYVREVVEGLA